MATKQTAARKRNGVSSTEAKRRQKQREDEAQRRSLPVLPHIEAHRREREALDHQGFLRVIPFLAWCRLLGISKSTGLRIIAAGEVKITHLSQRRIGIRSDHHQEYLDARCSGGRAA